MRWRLYSTLLLAVLCLGVSSAVAQSPEDSEALRRELAAERARLEEQMKRLESVYAKLDVHTRREAAYTENNL